MNGGRLVDVPDSYEGSDDERDACRNGGYHEPPRGIDVFNVGTSDVAPLVVIGDGLSGDLYVDGAQHDCAEYPPEERRCTEEVPPVREEPCEPHSVQQTATRSVGHVSDEPDDNPEDSNDDDGRDVRPDPLIPGSVVIGHGSPFLLG